jgi:hypothetical protein
VVLHETIHILGFAKELYPYYLKSDGTFYSATEIFKMVGTQVFMTLPTVREVAREYYNCSSLEGMLVENDEFYMSVDDLSNENDAVK